MAVIDAPSCRDDVLLAFFRLDALNPLLVFTWTGGSRQFVPAVENIRKFIPFQYDVLPQSATSFPFNHSGHLLLMDTKARPHVLSFHTHLVPVPDPVFVNTVRASLVMGNMRERIMAQQMFVERLNQMLRAAVTPAGPNILSQSYSFRDLSSLGQAVLSKIRDLKSVTMQGSPITMQDLRIRVRDLKQSVVRMREAYAAIEKNFKHIAFKNLPTVMSGQNRLAAADAFLVNASTAVVDLVSEVPVQQVMSSIFLPKQPAPVHARKFFADLRVIGHVSALINDVDLMNAVVVNRVNRLTAKTAISVIDVRGNLNIQRISGINLATDLIRIDAPGSYDIRSPALFSGAVWIDDLHSPLLDHVDMGKFVRNTLLTTGNQAVASLIVLNGKALIGRDVKLRLLNRLSMDQLISDVVRIDRSCVIPGSRIFSAPSLLIRGEMTVNGTMDGLRIPADLFLTSTPQQITAPVRLAGHQNFHEVAAERLVDGIRVPEQVVTLSQNDVAPGLALLKGADVFSSVTANKVDGVDLSILNLMSVKASEGKLLNPIFSGPVFVNDMLHVSGQLFCSLSIERLLHRVLNVMQKA